MSIDPIFQRQITREQMDLYAAAPASVYGFTAEGRLAYTNPAWDAFSAGNGGGEPARTVIGSSVFGCIPDPLQPFYRAGFAQAWSSQKPWSHTYECSSPTQQRFFHMVAYPLSAGGMIVANALRIERPHEEGASAAEPYRDALGVIRQCAHCRRVRGESPEEWCFIPALLSAPDPKTSHTLCGPCFTFHYPDTDD